MTKIKRGQLQHPYVPETLVEYQASLDATRNEVGEAKKLLRSAQLGAQELSAKWADAVNQHKATQEKLEETEKKLAECQQLQEATLTLADDWMGRAEAAQKALGLINDIRNSIIGHQTMSWSEHIYPLVAALEAAGYEGLEYPEAKGKAVSLVEQLAAVQQEIDTIKGIVGHPGTDTGLAWDCPTSEVVRYTHRRWLEQTHDLGQKVTTVEIERDDLQKKLDDKTTEAENFNSQRRLARRRLDEIVAAISALDSPEFLEQLAALAHNQWAGWMVWMFGKWDLTHDSGETYQTRWRRQAVTAYADLSETEKESDRIEARKVLEIISAILPKTVRDYADQNALLFGLVESLIPEVHAADHISEMKKHVRWQKCPKPICRRAQSVLGIIADSGPNNAA